MLISNEIIERYRYRNVLCIDPGTTTMGITIMRIDTIDLNIRYIFSTTLYPAKLVKSKHRLSHISDLQGNTTARLLALEEMLIDTIKQFNVMDIVCEDAFSAINVSTFATLIECQVAVRRAALAVNPEIRVDMVKASATKKNIGVPGNSGDKGLVREAIRKNLSGFIDESIDIDSITEHECDSIIIGFFYFTILARTGVIAKC